MIKKKRVVVTGIGIVSSLGYGLAGFKRNIDCRRTGLQKAKRINTSNTKAKYTGEIVDYEPEKIFAPKSIRRINRFSLLAMGAIKFAIDDGMLSIPYHYPEGIGLILSSDYGPSQTVNDYMVDLFAYGPTGVSPTLFSQTVMNVAIGYISTKFGLKGISSLIQGADGILFAYEHLRSGEAQVILTGGVDELTQNTFESYDFCGYLAPGEENGSGLCRPLDKQRKGTILGEGGCVFVLEEYEQAEKAGKNIYGEIAGIGISTDQKNDLFITEKSDNGLGLQLAMERAMENAKLKKEEIDCIISCANGSFEVDQAELNALRNVFGHNLHSKWIICGKSYYGECFHASAFFNQTLALLSLKEGVVFPTINVKNSEEGLRIPTKKISQKIDYVLCNNIYSNGTNISIIYKKHEA